MSWFNLNGNRRNLEWFFLHRKQAKPRLMQIRSQRSLIRLIEKLPKEMPNAKCAYLFTEESPSQYFVGQTNYLLKRKDTTNLWIWALPLLRPALLLILNYYVYPQIYRIYNPYLSKRIFLRKKIFCFNLDQCFQTASRSQNVNTSGLTGRGSVPHLRW